MIFKCQDPVVVQLTVNNNTLRLTESSEVQLDDNHSVTVSILRDENNLFFNVSTCSSRSQSSVYICCALTGDAEGRAYRPQCGHSSEHERLHVSFAAAVV